jgi:NAD(P)-dependent dehydrogenase (short-subunit alcohol dehydrogenase family)
VSAAGPSAAPSDPSGESAPLSFTGRVVVVTGAGRGVGRACAELLAERGATVVVNDTGVTPTGEPSEAEGDRSVADAVAASLAATGFDARASRHDTADPPAAAALVAEVRRDLGRLDAIVTAAGISWPVPVTEVTPDDVQRSFAVNAAAPLWLAQAAWPLLGEAGHGRIVTVASAGILGYPGRVHYVMAKAAVLGLTRSLALEGRRAGIGVNCVLPWARTRLAGERAETDPWMAAHLEPRDTAAALVWLAHPSCTTTGEAFAVEGRRVARVAIGVGAGVVIPSGAGGPEAVADSWAAARSFAGAVAPASTGAYVTDIVRPALDGAAATVPLPLEGP